MNRVNIALCAGLLMASVPSFGQGVIEQNAAINMEGSLNGAPSGAPPMPGAVSGPNMGGPMPAPIGGAPTFPGQPGALPGAFPGAPGGAPAFNGLGPANPGAGQPVAATPTPEATVEVLAGKRVYDAVNGALLEDIVKVKISPKDLDKYPDDGIHDNGIAGDGIRGNVDTFRKQYIGTVSNDIKNRLITLVRKVADTDPLTFYGYHFAAVDPVTQNPDMPNYLTLEKDRDESLREWNNKFLADYRVDKNDPQSEYYQLYIPEPPLFPQSYPPAGYIAPQKMQAGQTPAIGLPQGGSNLNGMANLPI
jgi:hypothetical protein